MLVERGSRLGLVLRAWGMRRGTLEEQRGVLHRRARHAEIGVAPGTEFNVDGEICELRPPAFTALPGGVRVVVAAMNKRWPAAIAVAGAAWYASESLRHRREQGDGYTLDGEALEVGTPEFLRACEELTAAAATEGSHAEVLVNGDAIFPAYLETIRQAESTINCLTYVYWRGDIAREVARALADRARDGLDVNLLLDAVGTAKMERDLLDDLRDAGVTVARFRPPRPYAVRRLNNRTHRKLLIADGRVGLTGGVGIAEEWTGDAQDPDHWRDTHVRVTGPAVLGLQGAFAENWLEATGNVLVGPGHLPELEPVRDDGAPMQVVRSAAGIGDTNIEALYFLAIASARERIELTAAYFVPRPAFIEALCDAADRGVAVRVLVPGSHIDKGFVRTAGRGTYEALLSCGVRIWEYGPTMLHAKTLVVDGAWTSVGSVNFDNRSFQLHDEVTLCVQSRSFADVLAEQFERDLAVSEEIDPGALEGARDREARGRGRAAPRPARALGVDGTPPGVGCAGCSPARSSRSPEQQESLPDDQAPLPRRRHRRRPPGGRDRYGARPDLRRRDGHGRAAHRPERRRAPRRSTQPGVRAVRRGKPIPSGYQLVGRKVSGGGSGVGAAIRFSCTGNKVLKTFGTVGSVGFSATRNYENHKSTIIESILSGSASGTVYAVCR